MKKGLLITLGVLVVLAFVIGGWLVGKYNTLVEKNESVDNAQAQVEVVLQRRFDLIPNLVQTVEGTIQQEKDIFLGIAEARTRYAETPAGTDEKLDAANQYESAIGRLLVVVENYPELNSNTAFLSLMDELAGSENRISVERGRYNDVTTDFNKYAQKFPNVFIANLFGFNERDLFESVQGADVPPVVNFDDEE